ncbi:MAG: Synechococcus phage [Bacteroidota bacterium]
MAQPTTRQELIDYCKRKLGAPVLEINVADEQIDDLVDDAIQFFQERHFDGVYPAFFKYKLTQADIDRGRSRGGSNSPVGIETTTATANIVGTATTFTYEENSNYLQVPPSVIGVNKIFHFDGTNTITSNMFSVKYQLFLNDIYYWGTTELLTYAMVKTYLEDIDFLLTTQKQIRFNKRQDRLYLDIDWGSVRPNDYLIIDCYSVLDPSSYSRVWNDSFLKMYLTSLIKRQWGSNLIKFTGVKLPGGVELNGRQLYDDAQREIDIIMEKMSSTYELPPLDMIG